MKECIQSYYIFDGKIRDCESFDNEVINEGTSVYEVLRLTGGRLLFQEDHVERLFASMKLAGIVPRISDNEVVAQLENLLEKNKALVGNVKLVINQRDDDTQHFLAYFVQHRYPDVQDYQEGVKVITYSFERTDPNKKIWRPEFRRKVSGAIAEHSSFEALLVDSGDSVTEASKANLFAISGGALLTPPDEIILPGITRKYVMDICNRNKISVIRSKLFMNQLPLFSALFLSGTSTKVLPVSRVDDIRLPVDNPIMRLIMEQYEQVIQNYLT